MMYDKPPEYFDDFLGYDPGKNPCYIPKIGGSGGIGWPAYSKAIGNIPAWTGTPDAEHAAGGQLILFTCPKNQALALPNSAAGFRVGDPGGDNGLDIRDWDPRKGLFVETAVTFSANRYLQASIGPVGFGDVPNYSEFYTYLLGADSALNVNINTGADGTTPPTSGGNFSTGYVIEPMVRKVLRLDLNGTEVKASIDGNPAGSYDGPFTPQMMMAPEFIIWNLQQPDGTWSKPWMKLDYIWIGQASR